MPKLISKTMHAYLDYPVAAGLIVMPYVFGVGTINPIALWLSVATGVAAFILTFLTDHHLGVVRILPYRLHLGVDLLVGGVFILAPHLLGFTGLDFWYFTILGLTVLAVVGLHKPEGAIPVTA